MSILSIRHIQVTESIVTPFRKVAPMSPADMILIYLVKAQELADHHSYDLTTGHIGQAICTVMADRKALDAHDLHVERSCVA